MLSKKIIFNLEKQNVVKIGRSDSDGSNKNHITINGAGILKDHAQVIYSPEDNAIHLKCKDMEAAQNTFVNGRTLMSYEEEEENDEGYFFVKKLGDLDRIIFGTSTTFLL